MENVLLKKFEMTASVDAEEQMDVLVIDKTWS